MNLNKLRSLIFAAVLMTTSAQSFAGTLVSIRVAPPPLPVYGPAGLPRPRLHLDPRILGLRSGWLFLGSRQMGSDSATRLPLDSRVLGMVGRRLRLAPWALGTGSRFLRWRELRLRLHRLWIPRRLLGWRTFLLQPIGHQREHNLRPQHLQQGSCRARTQPPQLPTDPEVCRETRYGRIGTRLMSNPSAACTRT